MYAAGDYDLAGFSVGTVERRKILPRDDMAAGDVILGLTSNGLHSNGFSLVRKLVEAEGLTWDAPSPAHAHKSVAEDLLTPTRIYVRSVLQALRANAPIKGLVHITGGGFQENLPRVLPDNISAHIDLSAWNMPEIFKWLQSVGNIEDAEMLRTFNCGIGMALVVSPDGLADVMAMLAAANETVIPIGTLAPRDGEPVTFSGSING